MNGQAVSQSAQLAEPRQIARAYEYCRAITRERARNFYYGIRLSREPQRSALFAVYAWMRLADDLVDAAGETPLPMLERRILETAAATDAALAGSPSDDLPLWLALADTARRFRLCPAHFHEMLDGQLADARSTTYQTEQQLLQYCRRVASTVGMICIEIWGYSDPAARELAAERGIAFQLTNILRDVAEDFDQGRVYLPREDFDRSGITPSDLRQWRDPDRCRRVMMMTIERADACYRRSAPLDAMVRAGGRPTLWAMTAIYQGLLAQIRADPQRVAERGRVRLSALRKGAIAIRAKWLSRFLWRGPASGNVGARAGNVSA